MTDETIEASYVWTLDEFLRGSEANQRYTDGPIVRYGLAFLGLLLGAIGSLGIAIAIVTPLDFLWPAGFGAFVAGAVLLSLRSAWFRRILFRRMFSKAGPAAQPDQKATFVFDESRVRVLTPGTEGSWIWELVPLVLELPDGYLVQCGGVRRWLPNHAFFDDHDRERFAQLAARRAIKFVSKVRRAPTHADSP